MLWVAEERLAPDARELVKDAAEEVFVSAVTPWEIEIKRALGRLNAPEDLKQQLTAAGFERLSIDFDHAVAAGRLPPIHSDPFDRMLVAQARVEGLTLATADAELGGYDVPVLAVTPA